MYRISSNPTTYNQGFNSSGNYGQFKNKSLSRLAINNKLVMRKRTDPDKIRTDLLLTETGFFVGSYGRPFSALVREGLIVRNCPSSPFFPLFERRHIDQWTLSATSPTLLKPEEWEENKGNPLFITDKGEQRSSVRTRTITDDLPLLTWCVRRHLSVFATLIQIYVRMPA